MHSSVSDREQDRSQPNNAPARLFSKATAWRDEEHARAAAPVGHASKAAFKSGRRLPFTRHEGSFFDIRR
jgi:hypothetical protein